MGGRLKRSRAVLALDVLILITLIAAVAVLALVVIGGVESASTLSIGTPTTSSSGGVTSIVAPIQIGDRGYFSISNVVVDVAVKDAAGAQLLTGTLGPFTVNPGQTKDVTASLVLDTAGLSSAALQSLATAPQNLTVTATLGASVPPFVGVSGSVSASLKWGAPVSGLTVGQPSFSQYNSTTIEASVPVTFANDNAYFTVSGDGAVSVLDSAGQKVGSGIVSLDVPPNTQYSQNVQLLITLPASQVQSLLTQDQTLSYTAVLSIPAGGSTFTLDEPISYNWGAPLSGLTVGAPVVSAKNSTAFQVSVPVSFADHSSTISVSTDLAATLRNATSGAIVGSGTLAVSASPGGSFSGDAVVYVQIPTSELSSLFFNDATLQYSASFTGESSGVAFSVVEPISVAWGAPVSGLSVGTMTAALYNGTYSAVSTPVSFTDASSFLGLSGTVSGTITDSSGAVVGTVSPLSVSVSPGQSFSGSLAGYIENSAAGEGSYVLHLTFESQYGAVTTEVTVAA